MVTENLKLVEKHAARLGVPNLKTDYRTLGGTQSLVDALIGGQMHFGSPRAGPGDAVDRPSAPRMKCVRCAPPRPCRLSSPATVRR